MKLKINLWDDGHQWFASFSFATIDGKSCKAFGQGFTPGECLEYLGQDIDRLMDVNRPPAKAGVLNSWKEIAAYLDRGVKTVQRWEKRAWLPVHRPGGAGRSGVVAIRSEIDSWLKRSSSRKRVNKPAPLSVEAVSA